MIEKDMAYLSIELIGLLTKTFQNNKISLEVFIENTILKVHYLEEYMKKNGDSNENARIMQLLSQYNKISMASGSTQF